MTCDYTPALSPRGPSELRCGHTDCCYYTPRTDSCDYLLIEFEPRGCPPTADCPRYAPSGRLREDPNSVLAARVQAYMDMGWSVRKIARKLRICEPALRRLRARGAANGP
jgi:hypothetical protein